MNLPKFIYAIALIPCLLIIIIEIIGMWNRHQFDEKPRLFLLSLVCFSCEIIVDIIDAFGNIYGPIAPLLGRILMTIYHISNYFALYFWFCYSELAQNEKTIREMKNQKFIVALIGIFSALTICGLIFKYDETGYYHLPLYYVQMFIIYFGLFFSAAKAFCKSLIRKYYSKRNEYRTLGSFVILPFASLAIQELLLPKAPIVIIGITISYMIVYQNILEKQISRDSLTGLNNRNRLIEFLTYKFNHHDKPLYLLMIDGNQLKKINDSYGHLEGDQAICLIAEALKEVTPKSFHIARFGGDEFMVIGEAEFEAEIQTLVNDIHRKVDELNSINEKPWKVVVSIGYAKKSEEYETILDFIEAADKKMYHDKRSFARY